MCYRREIQKGVELVNTWITALAVDDNRTYWRFLEELFRVVGGLEVRMAASISEAMDKIPELLEAGRPVIAILDQNIAGEHGEELAAEMRSFWQEAGRSNELYIIACCSVECTDWGDKADASVLKPLTRQVLEAGRELLIRQAA